MEHEINLLLALLIPKWQSGSWSGGVKKGTESKMFTVSMLLTDEEMYAKRLLFEPGSIKVKLKSCEKLFYTFCVISVSRFYLSEDGKMCFQKVCRKETLFSKPWLS